MFKMLRSDWDTGDSTRTVIYQVTSTTREAVVIDVE